MARSIEKYSIKRQQIIDAAKELAGLPFRHQGRNEAGADCVGILIILGRKLKYPKIIDVTDYRRVPRAEDIYKTLCLNMDEIALTDAVPGDVFLMRMNSRKARHAAIYLSDETDAEKGVEPTLIHAVPPAVRVQPLSDFPKEWFVSAFRLRGVKEAKK